MVTTPAQVTDGAPSVTATAGLTTTVTVSESWSHAALVLLAFTFTQVVAPSGRVAVNVQVPAL